MAICAQVLRALANAGASMEAVIAAVEAQEAIDTLAIEERRRKDRERKRLSRVSAVSRGQTVTPCDIADGSPAIVGCDVGETQAAAVEPKVENINETGQKETPPHPLKKNTTTSNTPPSEDLFKKARSSGIRARRKDDATRLPDDWQPSLDDLAYGRKVGMISEQITAQIEEFRDYWHARAGPDALKVSWAATWRRWCREFLKRNAGNGNANSRNSNYQSGGNGQKAGGFASRAVRNFTRETG